MDKSIFHFNDYKAYLKALAGVGQRKGIRLAIAKAAQCQPTYVSLVLNAGSDFSLEQGERISAYLGHSSEEMHYFLLLLQKGRAGTKKLAAYFQEQLESILRQRMVLTHRLGNEHVLSEMQQAEYYSSWIYAAVHIALSIPYLQDKKRLAQHLQIPQKKISEVIEFLLKANLIIEQDGGYRFGPGQIRLGRDSPNIIKHHTNWRSRAVNSLEHETNADMHYSGVFSVSKKDAMQIKDQLLEQLKETQKVLRESPEEELYCFNLDFFNLRVDLAKD